MNFEHSSHFCHIAPDFKVSRPVLRVIFKFFSTMHLKQWKDIYNINISKCREQFWEVIPANYKPFFLDQSFYNYKHYLHYFDQLRFWDGRWRWTGAHFNPSPLKIIKTKQKISFDRKKTTFVLDGFFETPFITIFLKCLNRDFTCISIPYVIHVYIVSFIIMS